MKSEPSPSPPESSGKPAAGISILSILALSLSIGLIAGAGIGESFILPVTLIAAVIFYVKRGNIAATGAAVPSDNKSKRYGSGTDDYFVWPELGKFSCNIRAEPYQRTIEQLVHAHIVPADGTQSIPSLTLKAHLVPDISNPFDSDIIRVEIDKRTVGYLYDEPARRFLRQLKQKDLSEQTTVCNALITAGDSIGEQPAHYSLKLDLDLSA